MLTRNILNILATASVLLAASFIVSCGGTANEAEGGKEASHPDSPAGVVEIFYKSLGSGECDAATQFLLIESLREIEIFMRNTASPTDIQRLDTEIRGMPEVESVKYVSKEEAMARLRESFKGREDDLNNMSGNPLPPSFEITVRDPMDTETVASRFFDNPVVDNTPGAHDGVFYRGETFKIEQVAGIRDFCDSVNGHGYEITKLNIISSSISDTGEANVNLEIIATMDGVGSKSGELSLTLVKLDGNWKIIVGEGPANTNIQAFPALMMLEIKESRQTFDTQETGDSWSDSGIEVVAPPGP